MNEDKLMFEYDGYHFYETDDNKYYFTGGEGYYPAYEFFNSLIEAVFAALKSCKA